MKMWWCLKVWILLVKKMFFEPNKFWLNFYWCVLFALIPVLVMIVIIEPIKEIIMLWCVAIGWSVIGILMCEKYLKRKKKNES